MSKKQTETKRYISHYSHDTWITAAQYIGEIMSERRATSLKRDLPNNFWNLPEWKKWYKYQVFLANGLLQKYKAEAIINTLISPDFKFVYSLKFKKFIQAVKDYKFVEVEATLEVLRGNVGLEEHSGEFRRPPQNTDDLLTRLKALDE